MILPFQNIRDVFFDIDDTIAHSNLGYSDVGYFEYVLAAVFCRLKKTSFSTALTETLSAESEYPFSDPFLAAEKLGVSVPLYKAELLEFQKNYVSFFEDAVFLIKALSSQGFNLHITSNNSKSRAYAILTAAELADWDSSEYFSSVFCPENTGFNKRNPLFYRRVIETGSFDPEKMLVVGDDAIADYDMPAEAGISHRVMIDRKNSGEDNGKRFIVSDLRNILDKEA